MMSTSADLSGFIIFIINLALYSQNACVCGGACVCVCVRALLE